MESYTSLLKSGYPAPDGNKTTAPYCVLGDLPIVPDDDHVRLLEKTAEEGRPVHDRNHTKLGVRCPLDSRIKGADLSLELGLKQVLGPV